MRRRWVWVITAVVTVLTVVGGGIAAAAPGASNPDPSRILLNQPPFAPLDKGLFSPQVYGAPATAPAATPQTDSQVRAQVQRVLVPRFVGDPRGFLAATAVVDDPALVAAIPDFRLRAAVAVVARTAADGAIDVFRAGTFRRVIFGPVAGTPYAVSTTEPGQSKATIVVSERYRFEDIRLLGDVLAHEALHSDAAVSNREELVANAIQMVVLAQFAIEDPALAGLRTELSRRLNTSLLALLNTRDGQGFIRVVTSRGNVYPGGAQPLAGFAAAFAYQGAADTPGSAYLSRTVERITGTAGSRAFDLATIDLLDRRIDNGLPASGWLRLASALRLQLTPPR